MGISAVGPGSAAAIAANAPDDVVSTLVLRKAIAAGASSTAQLLEAMPKLEPNKGNAVDLKL